MCEDTPITKNKIFRHVSGTQKSVQKRARCSSRSTRGRALPQKRANGHHQPTDLVLVPSGTVALSRLPRRGFLISTVAGAPHTSKPPVSAAAWWWEESFFFFGSRRAPTKKQGGRETGSSAVREKIAERKKKFLQKKRKGPGRSLTNGLVEAANSKAAVTTQAGRGGVHPRRARIVGGGAKNLGAYGAAHQEQSTEKPSPKLRDTQKRSIHVPRSCGHRGSARNATPNYVRAGGGLRIPLIQ